ncbi:MAG: hypothetical protein R8M14_09835 [Ghiorsea sp.]
MIRIVLALLSVIGIFIGLVLFPDIASQPVRIEFLGWLFETRTGMFILLIITGFTILWTLQTFFNFGLNSPKQLWASLRSGSTKRRNLRLQEALTIWIDEGEGKSQKLLNRSKGIVPDWLHQTLLVLWDNPSNHPKINDGKDTALTIALKARLATNPEHIQSLALNERQYYLDAWLSVHPAAKLALYRKAELLGDMGEYAQQVQLLESLMQKNKNIQSVKPLLARALQNLAIKDTENTLAHLRKANRLAPNDSDIITSLSVALEKSGDAKHAKQVLLDYLKDHDDIDMAHIALKLLSFDALQSFKQVDKPIYQNTYAGRWLRMMLAHEADLVGIANDALNAMLEQNPTPLLWQTKGDWLAANHEWEEAVVCYKKSSAP